MEKIFYTPRRYIRLIILSLFLFALSSNITFASTSFVVDGSNAANSTGPCVGKTVCHISGDLTYSNITLQNGAKLSHRQGILTVVNDFIVGTSGSSYFVGQDLNVGHQLKVTNASIITLNSNLTSEPVSTDINDWLGSSYYDLAITNTDVLYDGLDINLTSGGYVKTRNTVVNSRFKLVSNSTNPIWTTYANGYISIDGDANITNIKMDIDGYMYVGGNINTDHSGSAGYYMYIRGNSQIATPLSTLFSNAGMSVTGNLSFTGHTTPTELHFYTTSLNDGDNVYVGQDINMYKMQIGSGSTTADESLGNIESDEGYININNTNHAYLSDDIKAKNNIDLDTIPTVFLNDIRSTDGDITINNITTLTTNDLISNKGNLTIDIGTTHDYNDTSVKINIDISNITTLTSRHVSNSGTTIFDTITTYNREGNINTTSDISLLSVDTSSGETTNITSVAGKITTMTGSLHTYNDLSSFSNNTITNITDYQANNISSNAKLLVTDSTIEITNTDDEENESTPNIDISTGSDFVIKDSTANLRRSSIQVNGYLEIDNTPWVSQNLNINGYTTLDSEKVGIYFRNGKDRYIHGNIFAGGGSIWVGKSASPDNGNILLFRNTQVATNGALKVYRDISSHINRFDFASDETITVDSGLFSQLYNGASVDNGVSITGSGASSGGYVFGSTTNDSTDTLGVTNGEASIVIYTLKRFMTLSKVCITPNYLTPSNIKMQFSDAGGTVTNTQNLKLPSSSNGRTCFDINTTKAKSIAISGLLNPSEPIDFNEFEIWGVPTDVANIAVSLNDDITISNGSYELGGNITGKNLDITSTSAKKARIIQYSSNGILDAKSTINLTNTTNGNTLLSHSIGNELGLKFVTDSMTVGTGVLIDVSDKGYLGGNSESDILTNVGGEGNIIPGTTKTNAGDGGLSGGIGGYGVSGGGGGGGGLLVKTGPAWGETTKKYIIGSKGGGYTQTQCIIDNPGRLRCSGRGDNGERGDNTTTGNAIFIDIDTTNLPDNKNQGWTYISNGLDNTCGINAGKVYCWGNNTYGQNANGLTSGNQLVPTEVSTTGDLDNNGGNNNFVKVLSASRGNNDASCALKSTGKLFCWGKNNYYQINNGTTADILYPTLVGTNIKDFSTNYRRIAIVDSNGSIWQRGRNNQANITNNQGSTSANNWSNQTTYSICPNASEPGCGTPAGVTYDKWIKKLDSYNEAGGNTGFDRVFLNGKTGCALKSGKGYCWGYNATSRYSVGYNNSSDNYTPYFRQLRPNGSTTYNDNITEITPAINGVWAGEDGWCLLRKGAPYCWGYMGSSSYYALGQATTSNMGYPTYWNGTVSANNYTQSYRKNGNYSDLIPLYGQTCAVGNNGYLYCWGYNGHGYYTNGTTTTTTWNYPYQVGKKLNIGTNNTDNYPPFDYHGGTKSMGYTDANCVVMSDTSLRCSGYNNVGQLGDNTNTNRTSRVSVNATNLPNTENKGWTQVSNGYYTTCGINAGKVYCWGYNGQYQIGDGTTTNRLIPTPTSTLGNNIVKVLVGGGSSDQHACAMTDIGEIYCWGYGANYQIDENTGNEPTPKQIPNSPVTGSNLWKDFAIAYHSLFAVDNEGNTFGRGTNYYGTIAETTSYNNNDSYYLTNSVYGNTGNPCYSNWWCKIRDKRGNVGEENKVVKFDKIYAQYQTICGIKNGSVYCWGHNGQFNAGNSISSTTDMINPVMLTNITSLNGTNYSFINDNISELYPNGNTTSNGWCAVRLGKVYCWGYNAQRQAGQSNTSNRNEPYEITSTYLPNGTNSDFAGIMHGGTTSACGIHSNGAIYCWGRQSTTYGSWGDALTGNQTSGYAYQGGVYVPSLRINHTLTGNTPGFNSSAPGSGGGNLGYGGYGGSTCTGSLGNNELGNTRGGDGGGGVNSGSGTNWHGGGGGAGCSGGGGGTGGNSDTNPYRLGSGGGAGAFIANDFDSGYGGNGGGMIRISSNTLNISGDLLANGKTGGAHINDGNSPSMGAGAGGGGGSILIRAKALNCNSGNSIEVKGGDGGTGYTGQAGGGGGGGVITYYYTEKNGTCATVLTKGSAGVSGNAADGQDGLSYESAGTTFDTLRSRVIITNSPSEADATEEIMVKVYLLDVNGVPLEGEYLVAEVVGTLGTGEINNSNPLPQTDANGMIEFPITSSVTGIKKVIIKNAVTYTELQEQPTITFGVPSISIEKIADKSVVDSGDIITYTITITNSGSGDAGGDVENAIIIEDVLPTSFRYYTTGPTAGSKWDTGSGTTQYYIFPETSGDGTDGNEERLRYTITDGISGPATIPASGGKVRIIFDVKVP